MAARVVYLALAATGRLGEAPGVLPGNVLCLTFTNKATENLQQRIRRALASSSWPRARSRDHELPRVRGEVAGPVGMLAGIEPDQRVLSPRSAPSCARGSWI